MATILLADDDEAFCNLLQRVLSSHGHEVLKAYNGREALKLFRQHHPQITVLDLRMPEMDGLEVLRQIRTTDPQAVVMILTAWGTDELEQQARQHGAIDFLSKQLTYDSIVTIVEFVVTEPGKFLKPGSVLLVDKEEQSRNLFEGFLRDHGVSIRVARDGPEALFLILDTLPQLVVLDMDLGGIEDFWNAVPKMTVPTFFHALRQMRYPGGLILMSDRVEHAMEAHTLNLDKIDLLKKPVTPERLLVAVQIGMATMGKSPLQGKC
ncbi:MAG TPA: response regulator [Nitrospirales bacterium]|jgi:CheY-like chemotaxis protein|nr:response regulator [Nitrospirales bacterium]